jgi:hypothetical protein
VTSRCLVIVRAGDQSLHPQWTSDSGARKWDLVVSYFGNDPDRFRGAAENRIDDRGQKYHGLHALLTREDFWRAYDYVWLPDDDLATEQSSIDTLFATVARHDLALAQPALSWTSHVSHPITLLHPSFRLRKTNFVEIMAPCFHRPFLEDCLSTFTENLSGWGLDLLWPRLLAQDSRACAVIDDVVVTHTRPLGGPSYDKLRAAGVTPHAELEALMHSFGIGIDARPHVLAAIERDGTPLEQGDPRIRELLARDRAAFDAFRRLQRGEFVESEAPSRRLLHAGRLVRWRQ